MLIFRDNVDLREPFVGIKGGEVWLPCRLAKNVINPRNRILICSEDLVDFVIVDTEQILPYLAYKHNRRCPRGVRLLYDIICYELCQSVLDAFPSSWRSMIRSG